MGKNKKIKGRKRKKSRRLHTSTPSVSKKVPWVFIFGIIICIIIIGVSWRLFLSTPNNKPKEKKPALDVSESNAPTADLTQEEQTILLKEEELNLARQIMEEFPNSIGTYMLMGDLYARHGDSTEAVEFWKKSIEINPIQFDAWRNIGRIALEKEQLDDAVTFLRKALEIRPDTANLRSDIAKALMDSGNYTEAISELQQEIKFFPSSFTAHFQLAEAYRQQKEYDKAIEHYEQTIKLEPPHSHAYYGLAMIYSRTGQRDKAQENIAAFKKLRDKIDSVYTARQIGHQEYLASLRTSVVRTYLDAERLYINNGNKAKAEELLNRALTLDPSNTKCLERLASLYYSTNRTTKALQCFEKISQVDPNNINSYLNIGQVATRLKMFGKAERAFRKTIVLDPTKPVGYRELARFYLRTNSNITQAYNLAKKGIILERNAESYFLLGWAADVNGDRASALQAMEQAMKLQPKNQKYRQIYERIKNRN